MTNDTHKFYRFSNQATYEQLTTSSDTERGYPDDSAERWLPSWDDLFLDPETQADRLYCIKRHQFIDSDDFSGDGIIEIDLQTYLERLHWEPPVVEEEDELDELDEPEGWTN